MRIMSRKLSLKDLWNDTDGIILPYVTILLVVIIGVSVLALDGARYVSLQTQLQNGADQLALAAAAELDGAPDSITRANSALNTILTTTSLQQATLFGPDPTVTMPPFTNTNPCYLSAIPASDKTYPIPSADCLDQADPNSAFQARFVQVTVTPEQMSTVLPASFFGGSNSITAPATAVAGFKQNVCKFTPMYVCNPFEQSGDTYAKATERLAEKDTGDPNDLIHRQMYSLRYNPGTSFNPGNFGFLTPPLGPGVNNIRQSIARVNPDTCFTQNGVNTEPGYTGNSLASAFNTRFDLWQGSMNAHKSDSNYAPAPNVRKGYLTNNATSTDCTPTGPATLPSVPPSAPLPPSMQLPPDWCAGAYCSNMIGNTGQWDFDTYWSVEHPSAPSAKPTVNGVTASNCWTEPCTSLPSRYTTYLYEIGQNTSGGGLNDPSIGDTSSPPEQEIGAPRCNKSTPTPPVSADRRILYTAMINCLSLTASGILSGGSNPNVPVARFAKFFLIHPMFNPSGDITSDQIDAEFVGLVKPGDGVVRNTYQLYR